MSPAGAALQAGTAALAGPAVPALSWTPCDDGFQCATARVPLDYRHPDGAKISIALVRHLATDPAHRIGSLFVNGGGPGAQLAGFLEAYPFLPAQWRERFDIISFDPRGFGESTAVHCFASNAAEQKFLSALPPFPVGARQDAQWEQTYAKFDALCGERNSRSLLDHDTSADVARDMDLLRQGVGDPVLNYVGVSEGTGLGEIYANLFPGKVGRIILDTALDPVAWTTKDGPLNVDLRWDTDEANAADMAAFLKLCGQAATTACAFSAATPASTQAKWNTLLQRLRKASVAVGGETFTYANVISSISSALQTVSGWQQAAGQLQQVWEASQGPAPQASAGAARALAVPVADAATPSAAPATAPAYDGVEQGVAQFCTDGPEPHDLAAWAAGAKVAYARSAGFGLNFAWLVEACAQWPGNGTADQYTGPWNRPTANAILVVANTDDAALPYRNSVAAADDLGHARLLSVRGFGHAVLLSNPSTCATNYEDSYLETGALPPSGTVCQQDVTPFPTP
jgi:pimeloyl-ACP methyl ester carboxylesterase